MQYILSSMERVISDGRSKAKLLLLQRLGEGSSPGRLVQLPFLGVFIESLIFFSHTVNIIHPETGAIGRF